MMREVLERRFKRLVNDAVEGKKPTDEAVPHWPDLVIIDGGQGQLNAAREIIDALNLSQQVFADCGGQGSGPRRRA